MKLFEFVELAPFAEIRDELFDENSFLEFQWHLCANPEEGTVIPGTGGCRKIRWKTQGRGKRGGTRVIYFVQVSAERIVLMAGYAKNEREDIPREWLRKLKERFVDEQSSWNNGKNAC